MPSWLFDLSARSSSFMPHGHCYLWIPSILWTHVISDLLIGTAYVGISFILYILVRRIRLPFSPVFIAFGLFIGLCGMTHFMSVWTVWNPDYVLDGLVKAATAVASVATAIGLVFVRPQVEEVVNAARLSEERRIHLESAHAELEALYARVKELDEAKSRFFANVSHELRTPLTLILGPAERLLDDNRLDDEQRKMLTSISRNGKALLKQVNDLLDVSKLEAGRMQTRFLRFDMSSWLGRLASQFEVAAGARNLDFRVDRPDTLVAEADADLMERVVNNLLSNAFKFVPDGGAIRLSLEADDRSVRLLAEDNGPGIPTEDQATIFERFRQVDDSATRHHGGTGLGLAIAREIVELHHGSIHVESRPGQGARFIVELPRHAPSGSPVEDRSHDEVAVGETLALTSLPVATDGTANYPTPIMAPGQPKVLVVEDNAEMRGFIAATLEGCNVITAADGREGLLEAAALRPDLIITDIMMPRMSGDQLVHALRADKDFDAVPILLLSARSDDAQRIDLLRGGAQDYLIKPFVPQELVARAHNLLAHKLVADALREELAGTSGDLVQMARELGVRTRQLRVALDTAEVAREQAERASTVKSSFLGMISHELRTPLTTIQLNAGLLAEPGGGKEGVSARHLHRVERLSRAASQMSALIEGLLQYVRASSGQLSVRRDTIDLVQLVQEVVEDHAGSVPDNVELVFDLPDASLPPLECDPRLLRVIVSNLVSNALKFTRTGAVIARVGAGNQWHTIEIFDTGIGIPAEDLHRIFQPFEQLEPLHRKSIPGVGLGLTLVKEILDAMEGSIAVESDAGRGSTFRVRLPSRASSRRQEAA
ncbi:ATP-binding protein [Noviherbaspirillum galbum]|uniref:histidine kinase n=1 Tax=Noviherbaspirillum galbum TaxID=2709383 RepID=A0A6B3SYJ5_9BURK|nr:ATP-binding protein [Noviherbaspirillum galbum]NEX63069.1 response regulator [Noviherbaspirillum galbum]